jgi:hypothetical protein
MTGAMLHSHNDLVFGMNGLAFGCAVILAGFVLFFATAPLRRRNL